MQKPRTIVYVRFSLLLTFVVLSSLPRALLAEEAAVRQISGFVHTGDENLEFQVTNWKMEGANFPWVEAFAADFDGDGMSDIAAISEGGEIAMLIAQGDHRFLEKARKSLPQPYVGHGAAVDSDGDGRAEVAYQDVDEKNFFHRIRYGDKGEIVVERIPFLGKPLSIARVLSVPARARGAVELFMGFADFERRYHLIKTDFRSLSFSFVLDGPEFETAYVIAFADVSERFASMPLIFRPPNKFFIFTWWPNVIDRMSVYGHRVWAEFPEGAANLVAQVGEFDGDGRSDIVAFVSPFHGWWIARSNGQTGLEYPIVGLPPLRPGTRFLSGDVSGDGVDELLLVTPAARSVDVASPVLRPMTGVKVLLDNRQVGESDRRGFFSVAVKDKGVHSIDLVQDGVKFTDMPFQIPSVGNYRAVNAVGYSGVLKPHSAVSLSGRSDAPSVCTGYQVMGIDSKWNDAMPRCAPNYAIYSAQDQDPKVIAASGLCCRLPSDDILVGDPFTTPETRCPDNSVVVGWEPVNGVPELKCSRISQRYELGPAVPGDYWGGGYGYRLETSFTAREDIPEAIRHGIGRVGFSGWDNDGCIGRPAGALLVSKMAKRCSNIWFRELRYRGVVGDPPPHTPVRMFPDCVSRVDPFDPGAGCADTRDGKVAAGKVSPLP